MVKLIGQGCQAYVASLVDLNEEAKETTSILLVSEFLDVFLEELPGVPPPREVEFTIDIAQDFEPIYRAPYRKASTKLKELKSQLQEILQAGLIRPSTSL